MSLYKISAGEIISVQPTNFVTEKISEVSNLQNYISAKIYCLDPDLFVITTEFSNWEDSRRRIDILALDKDANLVVIELKRTEDGGHMELQALRYASMVAEMKFATLTAVHERYLIQQGKRGENAGEEILSFLGWEEIREEDFATDVRIILVSSDFSKEITTSVLWLNERDLNIKCIRITPYRDGETVYIDFQQIIPLKEAQEYQIKIRDKAIEERKSRRENSGSRDNTKFNVCILNDERQSLNKRNAYFFVIQKAIERNVSVAQLIAFTGERAWLWVNGECSTMKEFASAALAQQKKYDSIRWFSQVFCNDGKTYIFSNQHGTDSVQRAIENIFTAFPELDGSINTAN